MEWWQIGLAVWIVAGLIAAFVFGIYNIKEEEQDGSHERR